MNHTSPESTIVESVAKASSRLIEFPGVTRRTVPPWRKELSERVREVQERRAQEAATEAEATDRQGAEGNLPPPQLELLPQPEPVDVNPLVLAALKRIDRAHQTPAQDLRPSYPVSIEAAAGAVERGVACSELRSDNRTSRRAVAMSMFDDQRNDEQTTDIQGAATMNPAAAVATAMARETFPVSETEPAPERAVNLVVVPPAPIVAETVAPAANVSGPNAATAKPKARRVISDDSTDPALNYLDLVGVTHSQKADPENRAPLFSRLMAGAIDLLSVCFLSSPFAAVIELQNDSWREPRVLVFMASVTIVVMFIYLTVSTALTGKTMGTRLLSLRIIDARTGLIPTGQQAAGRAIIYILSLATAGVGFLMVLARGEGKTVHDRFSRTAVVRD